MKSVINAAARRNMEAAAQKMGPQAIETAAQAMKFRTEKDVRQGMFQEDSPSELQAVAAPQGIINLSPQVAQPLPGLGAYEERLEAAHASVPAASEALKHRAAHPTAKRVGDLLYFSGVVASIASSASASASKPLIATSYEHLPAHARAQLRSIGFDTGIANMDAIEAPIVAQSWVVLERIRSIALEHSAAPDAVFKLVVYLRDLRHYPAYQRVCHLFYPQGVVSTVVEVSRLLPNDDVLIQIEAVASLA